MTRWTACLVGLVVLLTACNGGKDSGMKPTVDDTARLQAEWHKFAPVELAFDPGLVNEKQKTVLKELIAASRIMNEIFLRQVYAKNLEIRKQLQQDTSEAGKLKLALFNLYKGPFNRLDQDKPFIGSKPKPAGANFYPEDMTKEAFQSFVSAHPDLKDAFESTVTVIRRTESGLEAVPYSVAYHDLLAQAADHLKQAAAACENESVKTYLLKRADAFLSNDYFDSDLAWMDMKDNAIEVVIGPYEVYEDGLFGYKASFESFVTVRDPVESEKLKMVAGYLKEMEQNLPEPDEYKNFNRGMSSPIAVVYEVFCAGDAAAGVQTTAFNLPNDERVREAKGSKKVLLKNVAQAKYDKCWVPIAQTVLAPEMMKHVSFNAYFTHTLLHEMSHGLGPGIIQKDGQQTTVNRELKDLYSTLEEAKADVLGVYNGYFLTDKGEFPKGFGDELAATFIGGIFRSVRFGIHEAHGGGNIIIFNRLMDDGVITYDPATGTFDVVLAKARDGFTRLAHDLLVIQATGDYTSARKLIDRYRVIRPEMQAALDRLTDVPVDIRPIFPKI